MADAIPTVVIDPSSLLAGLRVVEHGASAGFGGRVLAGLGAQVTWVGGSASRSAAPEGGFATSMPLADIAIGDEPIGDAAIIDVVIHPFGTEGPRSWHRANDLILGSAGLDGPGVARRWHRPVDRRRWRTGRGYRLSR